MHKFFLLMFLLFALGSCVTNRRLVYVQDDNLIKNKPIQVTNPKTEYIIQHNDVLNVNVKSSQKEITEVFNISPVGNVMGLNNPASFYISGYSVDESGYMTIPIVGKLKIQGLTLSQATALIQQELNKFINDASVQVKLVSFKISVLGEVKNPGYYYVYNNQATLLEGLGLAGDIDDLGNRNKIKLFRQTSSGSEVVLLDITDPNIIKSKYYYLLPNDVLYVEPLRAKAARGNIAQLGILFSGITTVLLIINFVKKN